MPWIRRHVRHQERRRLGGDGHDKLDAINASGADVLTAADTSCLLHLGGLLSRAGSPTRVLHLAEILAGDGLV